MNPVGPAALLDVSVALVVILTFVGGMGIVQMLVGLVRAELAKRAATREMDERLAAAADPLPDHLAILGVDKMQPYVPERIKFPPFEPAPAPYTAADCRQREAVCRARSDAAKDEMTRHMAKSRGAGDPWRKVYVGYVEQAACVARRNKQWADGWALLAEAIEDAEDATGKDGG